MSDDKPLIVVSSDTHVGPLLKEQLREFCPRRHLSAFDEYIRQDEAYRSALHQSTPQFFVQDESGNFVRAFRNICTLGHHDVSARLQDMNYDGIAAEVIFHGSVNDEPIPFSNLGDPKAPIAFKNKAPEDAELAQVGRHIYNEWLAEFCAAEPERHVGLAQLPIWDVEASVQEAKWAKSVGLRGLNFPAPQSWLPQYNHPSWEPLWSIAEELELTLTTHLGSGSDADYSGSDGLACSTFESSIIYGRRIAPWMIYSGVFERHPRLKLVITEIPGYWWKPLVDDMDSNYRFNTQLPVADRISKSDLRNKCPRLPSDYCKEALFAGASFMNHLEAESASRDNVFSNHLWGSDYPHAEGTFYYPEDWSDRPMTHHAMQFAFNGLPEAHVRAMLGENAVEVYGLDRQKLVEIASRINAPKFSEINDPIVVPIDERITSLAYRDHGVWD